MTNDEATTQGDQTQDIGQEVQPETPEILPGIVLDPQVHTEGLDTDRFEHRKGQTQAGFRIYLMGLPGVCGFIRGFAIQSYKK